jgi:hypothetical protein
MAIPATARISEVMGFRNHTGKQPGISSVLERLRVPGSTMTCQNRAGICHGSANHWLSKRPADRRALAKSREQRYRIADEYAAAIEHYLEVRKAEPREIDEEKRAALDILRREFAGSRRVLR